MTVQLINGKLRRVRSCGCIEGGEDCLCHALYGLVVCFAATVACFWLVAVVAG